MTYRRSYNLRGMDISSPYNSDRLWYLQDSVSVGPNAIRTRPRFPSIAPNSSGAHLACETSGSRVGSFNDSCKLNIFDAPTETFLSYVADSFPYYSSGTLCMVVIPPVSSCRVGNDTFHVVRYSDDGCYLLRWSGGSSNAIQSSSAGTAGASRTASVTSGSSTVTFSGALAADPTGSKINFTASRGHFYTIESFDSTANTAVLTRPADFTSGTSNFTIHGWSFLTTNNALDGASSVGGRGEINPGLGSPFATESIWETSSGGEPTGLVYAWAAEGHQGRLFISNGNEIRYSGTEDDVATRHGGVEYWDPDSRFAVAPELGSRVERMVSFNNDLIIFKDRGICVLRGTVANGDPTRLGARIDTISTHLRSQSVRHVIPTNLGVILVSTQGMYLVSGEGAQRMGDEVWPRLNAAMNESAADVSRVARNSLLMDDKAYIYFEEVVESNPLNNKYVYACLDTTTGEWSFRSFHYLITPGCSSQVEGADGTITVSFPANISGSRCITYTGGEGYGSVSSGSSLNAVGSSSESYDTPEFIAITSPFIGEGNDDSASMKHCRVRNIYTNSVVANDDDTSVWVLNNFGADYVFDVETITSGNGSAYPLLSSAENWYKHVVSTDAYGWGKGVAIINSYDGSGTPQIIYLRGLCVEYDQSDSIP